MIDGILGIAISIGWLISIDSTHGMNHESLEFPVWFVSNYALLAIIGY